MCPPYKVTDRYAYAMVSRSVVTGEAVALDLPAASLITRGASLLIDLIVYWVLITGGLGAIGCAIAGGHPLSILGAFVSSPVTPLHPALASGTVSALIEAWVRKPTYADFMSLRDDVQSVPGWWRNRVARVMLNFFLTSLGTAIGVWLGGARMLGKLIG